MFLELWLDKKTSSCSYHAFYFHNVFSLDEHHHQQRRNLCYILCNKQRYLPFYWAFHSVLTAPLVLVHTVYMAPWFFLGMPMGLSGGLQLSLVQGSVDEEELD